MKRANDLSSSADKQLFKSGLKAEIKRLSDSSVNCSPFKASRSFLLTPRDCQYAPRKARGVQKLSLRIRAKRFALNRRYWLSAAKVRNCE